MNCEQPVCAWRGRDGRPRGLLEKHPVAVSQLVAEAARARQVDPGIEQRMTRLDEELSAWALAAQSSGALAPRELGDETK